MRNLWRQLSNPMAPDLLRVTVSDSVGAVLALDDRSAEERYGLSEIKPLVRGFSVVGTPEKIRALAETAVAFTGDSDSPGERRAARAFAEKVSRISNPARRTRADVEELARRLWGSRGWVVEQRQHVAEKRDPVTRQIIEPASFTGPVFGIEAGYKTLSRGARHGTNTTRASVSVPLGSEPDWSALYDEVVRKLTPSERGRLR